MTGQTDKVWDDDAIRNSKVYNVLDTSNSRQANAWNAPGRSLLAAADLHGRRVVRDRLAQLPFGGGTSRPATGGC